MIERNVFEEQACMVKMNSGGLYTSATALLAKTPHRRAENMGVGGVVYVLSFPDSSGHLAEL